MNKNNKKRRWFHTEPELVTYDQHSMTFSLVESSVLVLPNQQHTLKMKTDLVPRKSGNIHILTRLSAPRKCYEFCPPESFETYISYMLMKAQEGQEDRYLIQTTKRTISPPGTSQSFGQLHHNYW